MMCGHGEFKDGSIYLGYYGARLYLADKNFGETQTEDMKKELNKKSKAELIDMFVDIIKTGSEE